MPLFDFECLKCHHVFETFLKADETPDDLQCPKCNKKNPIKLPSTFKTQGWSQFLDNMEKRVNPGKFK